MYIIVIAFGLVVLTIALQNMLAIRTVLHPHVDVMIRRDFTKIRDLEVFKRGAKDHVH